MASCTDSITTPAADTTRLDSGAPAALEPPAPKGEAAGEDAAPVHAPVWPEVPSCDAQKLAEALEMVAEYKVEVHRLGGEQALREASARVAERMMVKHLVA